MCYRFIRHTIGTYSSLYKFKYIKKKEDKCLADTNSYVDH